MIEAGQTLQQSDGVDPTIGRIKSANRGRGELPGSLDEGGSTMQNVITEDGKLTRGKHNERLVADLSNGELVASVNGFNPSPNATRDDREYLAAEMRRRSLRIPSGFVEGRAIQRRSDSGSHNGEGGSVNRINGNGVATISRAKTNGKPKPTSGRDRYGDGHGEINAHTTYNSEEFRRRISSGNGPMSPDTLTDYIRDGLQVTRTPGNLI